MDYANVENENVFEIFHWTGELPELVETIHGAEVCIQPTYGPDGQLTYRAMVVSPWDTVEDEFLMPY